MPSDVLRVLPDLVSITRLRWLASGEDLQRLAVPTRRTRCVGLDMR